MRMTIQIQPRRLSLLINRWKNIHLLFIFNIHYYIFILLYIHIYLKYPLLIFFAHTYITMVDNDLKRRCIAEEKYRMNGTRLLSQFVTGSDCVMSLATL